MRRIISILFLTLLLLQAIPVLHFFSSQKEIFYTYIDEEKPGDNWKEKKGKEFLTIAPFFVAEQTLEANYPPHINKNYLFPLLELLTPPPNTL